MEDNFSWQDCNNDDVLSFGEETYKVSRVRKAVQQSFWTHFNQQLPQQLESYGVKISNSLHKYSTPEEPYTKWIGRDTDCEILNLGSNGWQKGKVRIKVSVEFYIEEPEVPETTASNEIIPPESPLDDLRQMMNQENI